VNVWSSTAIMVFGQTISRFLSIEQGLVGQGQLDIRGSSNWINNM